MLRHYGGSLDDRWAALADYIRFKGDGSPPRPIEETLIRATQFHLGGNSFETVDVGSTRAQGTPGTSDRYFNFRDRLSAEEDLLDANLTRFHKGQLIACYMWSKNQSAVPDDNKAHAE